MNQEPDRDRELSAAMRRLEGDATLDEADWNRLRAGIAARAARQLASPREPISWWECIAGWSRAVVPLAAAAAVALLLFTPWEFVSGDPGTPMPSPAVAELTGLTMVASGSGYEQDVVEAIVGPSGQGWLLESVMGGIEQ